jgi:hypothetical protein
VRLKKGIFYPVIPRALLRDFYKIWKCNLKV